MARRLSNRASSLCRCSPRLPPTSEPFRNIDDIYSTASEPLNDTVMGDPQKCQIYNLYDIGGALSLRDAFFRTNLGAISVEEKTNTTCSGFGDFSMAVVQAKQFRWKRRQRQVQI